MRQLRLSLLLGLLLPLASPAFAQSVRFQSQAISTRGAGIANATVAVCSQPANTNTQPCSPLATLATSTSTTSGGANPLTADSFGNFFFYAAPGRYTVQIYGPAVSGQFVTPDVEISSTGPGASLSCKTFEGILCIDTTNTQSWAGTDIGGWFNSAYAAGPSTGAEIWQACNQSGATINFATPMVFQTSGKYIAPRSLGPTNQNGLGCGLNYTLTTATTAMTLDVTPTGGGGYEPGDLFGIHLINNGCVGTGGTNGGCGSSATGVKFGTTNGGAHMLKVHGRVAGFGTGIDFHDANGIGWGVGFDQFGCAWNTTCLSFPIYHENIHWVGGACAVNTTCISNASGSDIEMFGVSIDSNLSASGWINPTGQISCLACHFENLGPNNAAGTQPFLVSSQTGGVYNFSGVAINDNANVGSLASLFGGSGGQLFWTGQISSPNQVITNVLNNGLGMSAHLAYWTSNTANVGPACAVPFVCIVERFGYAGGPNMDIPIIRQPADVLGTITGTPNYATWHLDGTNIDERVNYNNAAIMGFAPLVVSRATTSQKTESAADTNVLTFTPAATVGSYRIRFVMSVSAANAATLGWTATWTDSNGNAQTPANLALSQTGVAAPALTFTTSAAGNYYSYVDVDVNNSGTNIIVKLTFSGTSFTAKVSATIERII